jgi:hypothetical protein
MTKNKGLWLTTGFLLLVFGLTSIVLQMVGVQWALLAFVVKILMIMGGVVLFVLARTDWDRERRESSN